jgi:hypothetical protein
MSKSKYLDLAGLTAYDRKLKEWFKTGLVDIEDEAIMDLFVTSPYKMVDLGLPSGLKWADRNVGADTPQDNGLYFSWGNVDGHAVENGNVADGYSFDRDTYATTSGGQYTGSTLDAEHDAATANMGDGWRMPTKAETLELVQNTDHYYIDLSGKTVAKSELSSSKKLCSICFVKKGEDFDYDNRSNFIEFPFAGDCGGSLLGGEGLRGDVWSSSVGEGNVEDARYLLFSSGGLLNGGNYGLRYYGQSVRGVRA